MKEKVKKLLNEFTSAHAAWKPLSKQFADLQRAALDYVASRDPRLANASDVFSCLELFIRNSPKKADRSEAENYVAALNETKRAASEAGEKLRAAKAELTAVVQEWRNEKMMSILNKRRQVQTEIITLLTPFCTDEREASQISQECGRLKELEFEAVQYRSIRDLETSAQEILK